MLYKLVKHPPAFSLVVLSEAVSLYMVFAVSCKRGMLYLSSNESTILINEILLLVKAWSVCQM